VARCGGPSSRPSSSYSGGSSSYSSNNGSAELGQALGQLGAQLMIKGLSALFTGIGKLFTKKPKSSAADRLIDNRHYSSPAQAPQPPPDPLTPSSLSLSVSRTSLAQGEELEAVATVGFTGKDGSVSGHTIHFTVVPGGKLNCPPGTTDAGGVARVTCRAIIVEGDRTFDALEDERRRRLGLATPGRIKRKPAKSDPIATLKERAEGSQDKLVIEEEKQPTTGTDTPGLDKTINVGEPEEYVVKGDRVTLTSTLGSLLAEMELDVLDRPCPTEGKCVRRGSRISGLDSNETFKADAGESSDPKPEADDDDEAVSSEEESDDPRYREKTRTKVRKKLPKDKQMGGEDTDPWKGKAPKRGTKERDESRREIEKRKKASELAVRALLRTRNDIYRSSPIVGSRTF
jgi:hypothetical protein